MLLTQFLNSHGKALGKGFEILLISGEHVTFIEKFDVNLKHLQNEWKTFWNFQPQSKRNHTNDVNFTFQLWSLQKEKEKYFAVFLVCNVKIKIYFENRLLLEFAVSVIWLQILLEIDFLWFSDEFHKFWLNNNRVK